MKERFRRRKNTYNDTDIDKTGKKKEHQITTKRKGRNIKFILCVNTILITILITIYITIYITIPTRVTSTDRQLDRHIYRERNTISLTLFSHIHHDAD